MSRSEIDQIFAALPPKKKLKPTPAPKSRQPETVVDPSRKQTKWKRRREKELSNAANNAFKDSRGSNPRRKIIEGYNIYNEDELGLSTAGGDTSLCPFDCQCCF